MKTIELKITKEDLEGNYKDIFDCPIARAFKIKFPGVKFSVSESYIINRDIKKESYYIYIFI